MSSIKIWETTRSLYSKCFLPVTVRVSKTLVLKLSIKVTFGDLRAQQISATIFQCDVLYRTEYDFI